MRAATLRAAALLAAGLAACTPSPSYTPRDWVSLPPDAVVGAGDPTRSAILNAAYAFGTPAPRAFSKSFRIVAGYGVRTPAYVSGKGRVFPRIP